jgi:hypothetical protein
MSFLGSYWWLQLTGERDTLADVAAGGEDEPLLIVRDGSETLLHLASLLAAHTALEDDHVPCELAGHEAGEPRSTLICAKKKQRPNSYN